MLGCVDQTNLIVFLIVIFCKSYTLNVASPLLCWCGGKRGARRRVCCMAELPKASSERLSSGSHTASSHPTDHRLSAIDTINSYLKPAKTTRQRRSSSACSHQPCTLDHARHLARTETRLAIQQRSKYLLSQCQSLLLRPAQTQDAINRKPQYTMNSVV